MFSFSYVEVAQAGSRPVVEVGKTSTRQVVTERRKQGARLRVYAQDDYDPRKSTLTVFGVFQALLQCLASPQSSVRDSLSLYPILTDERRFFYAPFADFSKVVPFAVTSWEDLESRAGNALGALLLLEADGPQADFQKLLDAISHDLGAKEDSPASAGAEASHEAAIAFRNRLLAKGWRDAKGVAELVGAHIGSNPNQYAARLRARGGLFGVWSAKDRSFLHPDFQFDQRGNIRPEVAELLKALPNEHDRGGWQRAFWLYSPHALLAAKSPAEMFVSEPARVIEVAKREFNGDVDAGW